MSGSTGRRRCAIYARKSTEEGLDQSFNSLDAQRQACAAYILSQAHEGWEQVDEVYDDGGYSGGSMDRPALRHLLEDIQAGKVDIIVVYKVDRLTRSLTDFARIVDVLDKHDASFVSITQAFNTTTSMGRLTLNVLLSFAQFEREVTGERIRDKIAASKARGMWMGGVVPLGYEVKDRKLVILSDEANRVRQIFALYLELGSVYSLQSALAAKEIRTKRRVLKDGRVYGDGNFGRGGLYQMLRNRIYLGEMTHRGKAYPGEHEGIIDPKVFDAVGQLLDSNRVDNRNAVQAEHASMLAGIIWDSEGRRMTPNHATKRGLRYRYYVSCKEKERLKLRVHRVPAGDIENLVVHQLARHTAAQWKSPLPTRAQIVKFVERVVIHRDRVEIAFVGRNAPIAIAARFVRRSGEHRIVTAGNINAPRRDPALIKLIVRAHQARKASTAPGNASLDLAAASMALSAPYFGSLLRIGHLAPDITAAILDGRQPGHINRQYLARLHNLPIDWAAQREMLGFD